MSNDPRLGIRIACLNTTCDYAFDAASNVDGKRPTAGDVSICSRCASLSLFTSNREDGRVDGIEPCPADVKSEILSDPFNQFIISQILENR